MPFSVSLDVCQSSLSNVGVARYGRCLRNSSYAWKNSQVPKKVHWAYSNFVRSTQTRNEPSEQKDWAFQWNFSRAPCKDLPKEISLISVRFLRWYLKSFGPFCMKMRRTRPLIAARTFNHHLIFLWNVFRYFPNALASCNEKYERQSTIQLSSFMSSLYGCSSLCRASDSELYHITHRSISIPAIVMATWTHKIFKIMRHVVWQQRKGEEKKNVCQRKPRKMCRTVTNNEQRFSFGYKYRLETNTTRYGHANERKREKKMWC